MKQASFIIDKKQSNNINKNVSNNAFIERPNSLTKEEPNKNLHDNNNLITSNKPRKHVENIYYFC
jgi:hypothetical protein